MGSESSHKLAFFDFNGVEPKNQQWDSVKAQVRQSLEEYGCFEASFNKVSPDIRSLLFKSLPEFFDLPLQTKKKNISENPYHGYVGQNPMLPLYEGLGIDDANILAKVESLTASFWPEGNPSFSKAIQSFAEELSELDQIIRRMILESLGVDKYLDEHLDSSNYLLRVMKYEGPRTTDTKLGLVSHTDNNFVTILYENEVEGLELQTKDGEWYSFKPLPNSFTVMIGESLMAWTNGRLHSPCHRVMITGNKARYTAGLFCIPKGGIMVRAPEELVDEEHPLLFKPFDAAEFLHFFYLKSRQGAEVTLKTYCGISN